MVHRPQRRFPTEPLVSDIIIFTRHLCSALTQAVVNVPVRKLIIRTLCAELLQSEQCCHLTVPAGTRVSFTANLIIPQCASSKNHSHQLPFQHQCAILLSKGLIGIIDQYVRIHDFVVWYVSGTDEPQGQASCHGWCLLSSCRLEKKIFLYQEMTMAKFHTCVPRFYVCFGKSADTEATIGLLQFFFRLSRVLYEHVEV